VIALQINGKRVELDQPTPLLEYLTKLGVDPRAVAVEHNGAIVERPEFTNTVLNEGDSVEIVRMVGGGAAQGRWSSASRWRSLP
jgi:sulfur carrier protein